MRKHKFKLESLLKYRKISEDKLRQELLYKIKELNECRSKLDSVKSEKNKSLEDFINAQSEVIDGNHLSIYRNYLNSLTEKVKEQEIKTVESKKEVDRTREDYLKARKELESVEKFKEKDFQNYLKEIRIAEQKILDEMAANQYNQTLVENRKPEK